MYNAKFAKTLRSKSPKTLRSKSRGRTSTKAKSKSPSSNKKAPEIRQTALEKALQGAVDVKVPARVKFSFNLSNAGLAENILRIVAAVHGYDLQPGKTNNKGKVCWVRGEDSLVERLDKIKSTQMVSRIPGMATICKKVTLAIILNKAKQQSPDDYAFWPDTWVLPFQQPSSSLFKKKRTYIYKPDGGAQGDGIYLLDQYKDLMRRLQQLDGMAVLQKYVPRPMLLDGFKFDLRIYVVILSLDPLRVFLCREGMVRVCSTEYTPPESRNLHKVTSHLTNYSINKTSSSFDHTDNPMDGKNGSKRTLSATMRYLKEEKVDTDIMWQRISRLVGHTCEAIAAVLLNGPLSQNPIWASALNFESESVDTKSKAKANTPSSTSGSSLANLLSSEMLARDFTAQFNQCFHVLGFDVLLDHKQNPILLEINNGPSLSVTAIHPTTGKAKVDAYPETMAHLVSAHPSDASLISMCTAADEVFRLKRKRQCKCMSHHRPHWHSPCAVDLVIKGAVIHGALDMSRKLLEARKHNEEDTLSMAELAEGTMYQPITGEEGQSRDGEDDEC